MPLCCSGCQRDPNRRSLNGRDTWRLRWLASGGLRSRELRRSWKSLLSLSLSLSPLSFSLSPLCLSLSFFYHSYRILLYSLCLGHSLFFLFLTESFFLFLSLLIGFFSLPLSYPILLFMLCLGFSLFFVFLIQTFSLCLSYRILHILSFLTNISLFPYFLSGLSLFRILVGSLSLSPLAILI